MSLDAWPTSQPSTEHTMPRTSRTSRTSRKRNPVTAEEFDSALVQMLEDSSPVELLAIPGMYELLSEAWNNEAIEIAIANREET